MKQGDRVRITGARGTDYGHVEAVRKPEELPDPPELSLGPAKEVLSECHVSRIALISHASQHAGHRALFAALECQERWYDLQGQELDIQRIGPQSVQRGEKQKGQGRAS